MEKFIYLRMLTIFNKDHFIFYDFFGCCFPSGWLGACTKMHCKAAGPVTSVHCKRAPTWLFFLTTLLRQCVFLTGVAALALLPALAGVSAVAGVACAPVVGDVGCDVGCAPVVGDVGCAPVPTEGLDVTPPASAGSG